MYTIQDAIRDAKFVANKLNDKFTSNVFSALPNVRLGGINIMFCGLIPSELMFRKAIEPCLDEFDCHCFYDWDGVTVYSKKEYEEYTA